MHIHGNVLLSYKPLLSSEFCCSLSYFFKCLLLEYSYCLLLNFSLNLGLINDNTNFSSYGAEKLENAVIYKCVTLL